MIDRSDRLADPNESVEERDLEVTLRPKRFAEFVGQRVAKEQLQDCRSTNDLRSEGVLRPPDRIEDRARFLHVTVFADGSEQVGSLKELVLWYACDALHHFRRVA